MFDRALFSCSMFVHKFLSECRAHAGRTREGGALMTDVSSRATDSPSWADLKEHNRYYIQLCP